VLDYTTSALQGGDDSLSVSYAAVAFFSGVEPAAETGNRAGFDLSGDERQTLLSLARKAIADTLAETGVMQPESIDGAHPLTPRLREPGACFVTLLLDSRLRGCIGSLEAREPLAENVRRNARKAAFRDPRFQPLTEVEFRRVAIEISVLTPARPISSSTEIAIGRHGIILEKDGHRAVYLPQVAPEQGWDLETTLAHLAVKAGLRPDAWRRNARFSVFEAIVFNETGVY
jgi:AmmeMemoRadiSam system protein A